MTPEELEQFDKALAEENARSREEMLKNWQKYFPGGVAHPRQPGEPT